MIITRHSGTNPRQEKASCRGIDDLHFTTNIGDVLRWDAVVGQRLAKITQTFGCTDGFISPESTDNQGLRDSDGIPALRAYMFGRYRAFIWPGDCSINATLSSIFIVSEECIDECVGYCCRQLQRRRRVINRKCATLFSVTPARTSSALSIATWSDVSVLSNFLAYIVPAESVTTFVRTKISSISIPCAMDYRKCEPEVSAETN